MPADVYAKIEKKILDLRQREDVWKKRYKDIAQEVQGLVDANAKQLKSMQDMLNRFDRRLDAAETAIKKNDAKAAGMSIGLDKRIAGLSGNSRQLSEKAEDIAKEFKTVKSDLINQVNSAIARHERTFDNAIKRIESAAERVHGETLREQDIYEKIEGAKKVVQDWKPPAPDPPPIPAPQITYPGPRPSQNVPQQIPDYRPPAYQPLEREPVERFFPQQPPMPPFMDSERPGPEPPFVYDPSMPLAPPSAPSRRPARQVVPYDPDLDDDLDMDDDIGGRGVKNLDSSVQAMNSNVSSITEKLAAIEDAVSRISGQKNAAADRLDDKIRMYSESVADMHNRMETVERAMKDGLSPMMETMKILTETVKDMKRNPGVPRPTPPRSGSGPSPMLRPPSQPPPAPSSPRKASSNRRPR